MSAHIKKVLIQTAEVKGNAVCLLGEVQIAVFMDYNLNRHYETKHAEQDENAIRFLSLNKEKKN